MGQTKSNFETSHGRAPHKGLRTTLSWPMIYDTPRTHHQLWLKYDDGTCIFLTTNSATLQAFAELQMRVPRHWQVSEAFKNGRMHI